MSFLRWRRATELLLPRFSTGLQLSSGSRSTPDTQMRPKIIGSDTEDISDHGNVLNQVVMSPVEISSSLPDMSPQVVGDPDLAPPDQQTSEETLFYDVKGGSVWNVWPRMPKDVRRWEKPAFTPMVHVQIPAGSLGITSPPQPLPEGWQMYTHPEGKPYYHRDAREPEPMFLQGTVLYELNRRCCRALEIVTDSDPRDPLTRKLLEHAHFMVRVTIQENNLDLPNRVELFLELYPAEEPELHPYAGYYLADHDNKTIFWGAPSYTGDIGAFRVNPKTFSNHHLKLQMTQQYWYHVQCYPLDGSIEIKTAQSELMKQLTIMQLDVATSPNVSTSDFSEEQCERFQSMLRNCPASCKAWMVARLMTLTTEWQFLNFYGHPSARLNRYHSYEAEDEVEPEFVNSEPDIIVQSSSTSVTDVEPQPPELRVIVPSQALIAILLRLCCFLLFDAPAKHNEELQKIWVDKIVNQIRFQEVINRTVEDWERVSLLSTVLWTANMGFLAIVDPLETPPTLTTFGCTIRRAMVISSLTSTVFSVGSIMLGLLHIRKHRVKWSAVEARLYLEMEHHPLYGHRLLSILWALPFAFLMSSIVAFSTAILIFCVTLGDLITKAILLTLSFFMVAWITLSVWYFWKRETQWKSTVEGTYHPSFRMQFTSWLWGLSVTPPKRRKTV